MDEKYSRPRPDSITDPCWDWQQRAFEAEAEVNRLRAALTAIRDKARSWEGRSDAPYWNLGDIAAAALKGKGGE